MSVCEREKESVSVSVSVGVSERGRECVCACVCVCHLSLGFLGHAGVGRTPRPSSCRYRELCVGLRREGFGEHFSIWFVYFSIWFNFILLKILVQRLVAGGWGLEGRIQGSEFGLRHPRLLLYYSQS